jgi:hypothetical protein
VSLLSGKKVTLLEKDIVPSEALFSGAFGGFAGREFMAFNSVVLNKSTLPGVPTIRTEK